MKLNRQSRSPYFGSFESFVYEDLTEKLYNVRCSRLPDVDVIKILIKMIRPQNMKTKGIMFCGLVIFIRILIPSTSGGLDYLR